MNRSLLIGAVVVGLLAGVARAQTAAPAGGSKAAPAFNMGGDWESTPQSLQAIEKGLLWLSKQQKANGAYGSSGGYTANVAIAALAGMAFLADGNTPNRGRYSENVEKVLDYLMVCTSDSSGLIVGQDASSGPMYGHGFATLFLAEAYGMSPRPELRGKLEKAVRLIVNTQNPQGGWRYMPVPADADLSVTICQTMALRAARNAGIKVPRQTIDKAIDYVRKSQNKDGSFNYILSSSGGSGGFSTTAAGTASLYYSGVYSGKEVETGVAYLLKAKTSFGGGRGAAMGIGGHFFYGHYYGVQAFFLAGGDSWKTWYPLLRDSVVKMQNGAGHWTDGVGNEYATAMALIILQVPNRYLPILER